MDLPQGYNHISRFKSDVLKSNLRALDLDPEDADGDGIDIGIADSLYKLKEGSVSEFDIISNECLLEQPCEDIMDTCGHGTEVFDIVRSGAPEASYHFLRVTTVWEVEGTEIEVTPPGNLLRAFKKAIEFDIDLLNLSQGIPEPKIGEVYVIPEKVTEVVKSGTSIVASAGNENVLRPSEHVNATFYPARNEELISVAGYEPKCGTSEPKRAQGRNGPLWAKLGGGIFSDGDYQGPYCRHTSCIEGKKCEENRKNEWWEDNVNQVENNPDLIAPVNYFGQHSAGYSFKCGTSYAAPLVTGVLATILSHHEFVPDPHHLKEEIKKECEETSDQMVPKLSAENLKKNLI